MCNSWERRNRKRMAYTYINTSEGIGSSIITLVKGVFQLGAQIIDKSLDPSFGVVELAAVGIALAVLTWMVTNGRHAKDSVMHAF
jgi:hypothetical protein